MASKTNKKAEQKQKMCALLRLSLLRAAADGHPALCRFQPAALNKDEIRRFRFLEAALFTA